MLLLQTSTSEKPPTATVCLPLLHRSQCLSTTQTTPADQLHAQLTPCQLALCGTLDTAALRSSLSVWLRPSLFLSWSRIGLLSTSLRSVPVSNQLSPPDSREKPDRLLSPSTIACLRPSWFSSGLSRSAGVVWLAQSELACYAFQTSTRVNQQNCRKKKKKNLLNCAARGFRIKSGRVESGPKWNQRTILPQANTSGQWASLCRISRSTSTTDSYACSTRFPPGSHNSDPTDTQHLKMSVKTVLGCFFFLVCFV